MNVFNRIFTVVGIVVLIVVGAATLISPATVLAFIQNSANLIRLNVFAGMTDWTRFGVRVLAAVIFVLIMLGLLWLELRRPVQRTIEVGRYSSGTTIRISTDAVESKIRDAVDSLGGVIGARVQATHRNKSVDLSMDVLATRDTDLVAKAEEIAAITRLIVQDQLGLKLYGKPQVTIKAGAGKAKIDRKPMFPFGPKDGEKDGGSTKPAPVEEPIVISAPQQQAEPQAALPAPAPDEAAAG
jgi:hypothetical protein